MKINLNGLAASLQEAPEEQNLAPSDVPEYVIQHIYEPLLRGEKVLFADLNFDAFTDGDLRALENWIEVQDTVFKCLTRLNHIFCEAVPVSVAARAFC